MDFSHSLKKIDSSTLEIKLSGNFDENATLPNNLDFDGILSLYIDFNKIEFINSGGIKVWINFCQQLEEIETLNVYFRKCKRIIIDQINSIEGFLPKNAEILSFYIPVFCNKCENSFDVFHDIKKLGEDISDVTNRVETTDCDYFPKCRKNFEVDIMPRLFFKFLKK